MTVDDELLAAIANDPQAYAVYADHLEEQGQLDRAALVRMVQALESETNRKAELALATKILDAAAGMPREWLLSLSRGFRIDGHCYGSGIADNETYLVQFQRDSFVEFRQGNIGSSTTKYKLNKATSGHWMQIGRAFTFAIGDYSHHDGVIAGENIVGMASDPVSVWSFELERVTDEQFTSGEYMKLATKDGERSGARVPVRAWRPAKPAKPTKPAKPAKKKPTKTKSTKTKAKTKSTKPKSKPVKKVAKRATRKRRASPRG